MNTKLPATLDSTADLDAYEAEYMSDGPIVHRSKTRASAAVPAFIGASALFMLLWCASHAPLGLGLGIALALGTALLGLLFTVIRVTVSSRHVDVQHGLLGPKIPLAAIESVEAVTHDYGFARWGVTPIGFNAWLYTIAGDEGRAVKIVWRGPGGQRRVHVIGSVDHEQLAAAIDAARAAAPSADARPRAKLASPE